MCLEGVGGLTSLGPVPGPAIKSLETRPKVLEMSVSRAKITLFICNVYEQFLPPDGLEGPDGLGPEEGPNPEEGLEIPFVLDWLPLQVWLQERHLCLQLRL